MPSGSCFCGQVKYSYEGEPQLKALCHCADCAKIGGSPYSTNVAVKEEGWKAEGTPKGYTVTADSGKKITSMFCPNCGSTMWREGDSFPGLKIIKVGTLDDPKKFETFKPDIELFAPHRPSWLSQVSGTQDAQGMPG